MKKLAFILNLILLITNSFNIFAQDDIKNKSLEAINKAKELYKNYKIYENRTNEIRDILNNANNLINKAEDEYKNNNFKQALSKANSAINILQTIPSQVQSAGDGTEDLTGPKILDKINHLNTFYEKIKKYNFNNSEINNNFTNVNNKIRLAKMCYRDGKYKKANELIIEAYKLLFEIPPIYKKVLERHESAKNEIFKLTILSQFIQRYYVQEGETKVVFRDVKYWVERTERYFEQQDFTRFQDSINNFHKAIEQVKEKRKEIDKKKQIALKQCADAHYMILFAEEEHKKSSEQLEPGPMIEVYTMAKLNLDKARSEMNNNRCVEAYQNAINAAELFRKVKTHRKEIIQAERLAKQFLKEAEELYGKAKKTSLPFDVMEQVNKALDDINKAKKYMLRYEYLKAYNELQSVVIFLKSILR